MFITTDKFVVPVFTPSVLASTGLYQEFVGTQRAPQSATTRTLWPTLPAGRAVPPLLVCVGRSPGVWFLADLVG